MDIFLGYTGVALAFVIVMFVLTMIFIKANNISWKLKLLLIPMIIWYSVALYHVPANFKGWPADKWMIQNEVIILDIYIEEDKAIYFWVIDYNIHTVRKIYDPRTVHMGHIDSTPRAYVIEYDSGTHKALVEARRKLKELGRGGLRMNMDRLQGMSRFDGNKPLFNIFDPAEVMKKETDEQ